VLTTNERLTNVTEDFESATVVHSTIEVDGYGGLAGFLRPADSADDRPELNVKEIRPPRMDDSGRTKYPVLFRV
jgi:dipeptidyl aminopeptidase